MDNGPGDEQDEEIGNKKRQRNERSAADRVRERERITAIQLTRYTTTLRYTTTYRLYDNNKNIFIILYTSMIVYRRRDIMI